MSGDSVTTDRVDQVIGSSGSDRIVNLARHLAGLALQLGPDVCDPEIAEQIRQAAREAEEVAQLFL